MPCSNVRIRLFSSAVQSVFGPSELLEASEELEISELEGVSLLLEGCSLLEETLLLDELGFSELGLTLDSDLGSALGSELVTSIGLELSSTKDDLALSPQDDKTRAKNVANVKITFFFIVKYLHLYIYFNMCSFKRAYVKYSEHK